MRIKPIAIAFVLAASLSACTPQRKNQEPFDGFDEPDEYAEGILEGWRNGRDEPMGDDMPGRPAYATWLLEDAGVNTAGQRVSHVSVAVHTISGVEKTPVGDYADCTEMTKVPTSYLHLECAGDIMRTVLRVWPGQGFDERLSIERSDLTPDGPGNSTELGMIEAHEWSNPSLRPMQTGDETE